MATRKKTKNRKTTPSTEALAALPVMHHPHGSPAIIPIDFLALEELCGLQCTEEEIAEYFHCSIDTLGRRIQEEYSISFADYYDQKKGEGKVSLRRLLRRHSEKNFVPAIFEAKNHLGMADKQEVVTKTFNYDVAKLYSTFIEAQRQLQKGPAELTPGNESNESEGFKEIKEG